jgi:pimeloyl-ACP methyl ester carboxylesterase
MSQDLKHGFIYANGIRMHYVEQGEGPLVVLCHGWPESWYSWRHQMPALAAAGYRVVAPDQRGYGLTDAPTAVESYDVLHLAGDLVGLVNALGEQQAVLMGHDWGSIVASTTALLRPDMVRALGLLSVPYLSRGRIRPSAQFHMATQQRHFYQDYFQQPNHAERELEEDLRRTFLGLLYTLSGEARIKHNSDSFPEVILGFNKNTRFIDNIIVPEGLPSWLTEADLNFMVEEFGRSGFRGPINWYRNIDRNWEITPFLNGAKIPQPTLFLAGALDVALKILADQFESLEVNVPKLWKKNLIPGAGHCAEQEKPEEVNKLLLEFLASCSVGQ